MKNLKTTSTRNTFYLAFIMLPFFCYAVNVDSIINRYPYKKDVRYIDSLVAKGKTMMFANPEKALELLQKTNIIAKKSGNAIKIADTHQAIGVYYATLNGDYEMAAKHYHIADSIYRRNKGKQASEGIGGIYHCYGVIKQKQGDYPSAIELYTKALRVFDSINNQTTRIKTLNNLSTLYTFLKDYHNAEKYGRECLKLATKNNDKFAISNINCTLAALLIAQGKYSEVPTLLDNAEQIAKSRNDNYILDLVNVNYGSYYQFYKKDNIKAIQHYVQAREYAIKLGSEYEEMRAVSNLSETYLLNNQLNEAIVNAERAIALAEKMGYTDARQRMLEVLSKAEAGKHDYEKAYKHLLFSSQLKDSVFNETNSEKINSLEIKYQTEKKENEINNLSAQKRQRTTLNYFLATAILSLIVLMYLFYRGKQKSKIIAQQALLVKEKQIAEMEKERQLIAAKSVLEGEETERIRLANDLHDGLGGLLSGVKLNLSSMKENNILSVENTAAFNRTVGLLDNSIKELRRIAHNLMPENLMRFGLKYAISEFVSSLNDTKISFSFYGEETRYEKELELTVYRITQELVNNALKYSEATQIGVQLILENERINVPVMDNGVGFDKSIIDGISKGTGLQQIKNRVNAMNGKFEINSTPNEGTEAYIEFSSI